jgi:hypothetical protein
MVVYELAVIVLVALAHHWGLLLSGLGALGSFASIRLGTRTRTLVSDDQILVLKDIPAIRQVLASGRGD